MPFVASGSYDLSVRVWDTNVKAQVISVPHPEAQINCVSFIPYAPNPRPSQIAIGTFAKLKIFDITTSQPVLCPSFEGAGKNIVACGFDFSFNANNGGWMFAGGDDGHVRIFDMSQRQPVTALPLTHALEIGSPITSVILHQTGAELFIADQAGRVHIWDLSKQANETIEVPQLEAFEFIVKLAVHPNGSVLSGITNRGNLLTWLLSPNVDTENLMIIPTTTAAQYNGMCKMRKGGIGLGLKYTRDGRFLICTFSDSIVEWLTADDYPNYDRRKNNEIKFETDCDWNWDTIITQDSRYMITGGSDGKVKIWNVETKQLAYKLEGHQKGISALAISEFP